MKIVINKCYGGFSLSWAGVKRYAELCGFTVHRFEMQFKDGESLERLMEDGEPETIFQTYKKSTGKSGEYFSDRDIPRDDPRLVAVVEELGKEADGRFASLEIVEIPDEVEWEIGEYDGLEHVAEKHRTWY